MARRLIGGNSHENGWLNATWMPHVSLSQTSHVALLVRSAFVTADDQADRIGGGDMRCDWKIQVNVHGTAGIPLVPISTSTSIAAVQHRAKPNAICSTTSPAGGDGLKADFEEIGNVFQPRVSNFTHLCEWNEMVQIPLRWRDLPRDTYLQFRILGVDDSLLYETTLSFFDESGRMKTGLQKLRLATVAHELQEQVQLHSSHPMDESKSEHDPLWDASLKLHSVNRLQDATASTTATTSKTALGYVPSVPWLDKITADHCKDILSEEYNAADAGMSSHGSPYLIVELPEYVVPVMHEETFYALASQGASGNISSLEYENGVNKTRLNAVTDVGSSQKFSPLDMVPFLDYEDDNVFEDKYRTLAHDLIRGMVDPALKPDRLQRDRLAAIIASPSHHPTREEKDLLWRFRFSLVDNRRALTKFLLAVDWTVEGEVVQAAELLEQWRMRSPIGVTDALKLLGKQVAYQTSLVRAYAIDTLASAPDNELRLYLLQLVQALKFESQQDGVISKSGQPDASASSLGAFLIDRASKNLQLANYLYWYLKVELHDAAYGARYKEVFSELQSKLSQTPCTVQPSADSTTKPHRAEKATNIVDGTADSVKSSLKSIVSSVSKLGVNLVGAEASGANRNQAKDRSKRSKLSMWDVLTKQDKFISGIMDVQLKSRDTRGKKDAKEANLKEWLAEGKFDVDPKREPVPLPSAPNLMVNGVSSSSAKMFKSALYPALLEFNVVSSNRSNIDSTKEGTGGGEHQSAPRLTTYKVIVKTGDDLRQDQLVIMLIQLMDGLLKRATLDLCLTPYSIIATSPSSGLVDFVNDSIPVSAILAKHNGSILQFFKACAPQAGAKYDIQPDVMSAYVRSCAGYCVITYLLGVGDRHLDNILITTTGRFFHIDFGFILGRDPKPLPPPFRLTREMVEGMGGLDSIEYRQFCSLSCQAFNTLRKSAGLVLNLLHLMSDAGIEDLSNNPTADPDVVISRVEERFRLDLTDEKAERFFLGLINDSLTAIAPRVMDVFHSIAVARR